MKFKDTEYGDLLGQVYESDIDVSRMNLTSLEGAPKIVNGYFDCSDNKLTSLKFAPEKVGSFRCTDNELTTLEGAPQSVDGDFKCVNNNLQSLKGAPKIVNGWFDCSINELTTLEGAPKEVNGVFYCSLNSGKHLDKEWEIRQKNPNLSEEDINLEMFKLTNDNKYISKEAQDMFIF